VWLKHGFAVYLTKSTSWWQLQCWDHPGWKDKQSGSFGNPRAKASGAKPKALGCKACWSQRIEDEIRKDAKDFF